MKSKVKNTVSCSYDANEACYTDRLNWEREEYLLQKGIEILAEQSGTFQFLEDDEDLYTVDDIIPD